MRFIFCKWSNNFFIIWQNIGFWFIINFFRVNDIYNFFRYNFFRYKKIFIIFGILIAITAIAIFPSESSWGSIYSVLGAIISLIGINKFTKKLSYPIRLLCNFGYFIIFIIILITIDYIGVINIHQAPRFALFKITGEDTIYYDTPFYDVVRCNVNESNEEFKVFKNQTYDKNNIDKYCK